LRRVVLTELVPRLDGFLVDSAEDHELSDVVWGEIADVPFRLLDPRGRGDDGLGITRLTVAIEALATGRQTYVMPVLLSALPSVALLLNGCANQQRRFLGPIRTGSGRAAFALSEAGAGSDVSAIETVAEQVGDEFVLRGRKAWISVPDRTDWILVFAKPADARSDHALSCLIVPAATPGVSFVPCSPQLGMSAVPLRDVVLDDVVVAASQLVGRAGGGFGIAMRTLNAVRPLVAARGLGLVASVLMAATRHVEGRRAFGGSLADLQQVRAKLAGLAARLEAARLLTYYAAQQVDAHGPGKEQAPMLAAAKLLSTELAVEAATTCMHLAGAAGYTTALPFERALREAQQLTVVEGASEVQLELLDRTMWWDAA
jgi:alkylation response protein AidB-like acyl-CoA dehydrogenase